MLDYVRDPAEIYRQSFATIRAEADLERFPDDIARAVPHAQLLKLPACGHSPHKDQPEAVTEAIEAFIRAKTA